MAVNSISGYSTTRITGLTSGLDTDSLVEKLMQSEQAKLDRLFKTNTSLGWKKDAYTGVNNLSKDFRSKFISTSSSSNIWSAATYKAYKINMTESKYLDIKATSLASIGNHKITSVKMAENAKAEGTKHRNRSVQQVGTSGTNTQQSVSSNVTLHAPHVTDPDNQIPDLKLSELTDSSGNALFDFSGADAKLSLTVNDKTFVFDGNTTVQGMMDEMNSRLGDSATVSLDNGSLKITGAVGETLKLGNVSGSVANAFGSKGIFGTSTSATSTNVMDATMSLSDLADKTGKNFLDSDGKFRFSINGESFEFEGSATLEDVMQAVEANGAADAALSYDSSSDKFIIRTKSTGSGASLKLENEGSSKAFGEDSLFGIEAGSKEKYDTIDRTTDSIQSAAEKMGIDLQLSANGKFEFTVNGVDFSFNATDKLQTMIDKVNGDSEAGVTLSYSQITDQFVFTSKETGDLVSIELENKNGTGAFGGDGSFFGISDENMSVTGSDAVINIDGEEVRRSTNTFVLDGIEFNLKGNFNVANDPITEDQEINFSVSQDVDSVVDKVKAFVDEYNSMVSYLAKLIKEEVDYDYEALTQAERDSLSDEEIEKWEAQAKQGILRNDSTIQGLLTDLRNNLFQKVGDTGLSPHDIGLSTANIIDNPDMKDGQISFDEEKFRAALVKNPDAVAKVMSNVDTDDAYENNGLATRLFNQLTEFENKISKNNIKTTEETISKNETKMEDMLQRMYEMEEKYYLQFAQMETLLTQYQSQSEWLTQQLSSL